MLIVGDYTTRIGDPSGRSATRPMLDPTRSDRNAQRYFRAGLHDHRPRAHRDALQRRVARTLDFAEMLRLTRTTTVAQLLERDDFSKRFTREADLGVRAALPVRPGVRLRRGGGRRRGGRHRPALQPPDGTRRDGRVRSRAAGRSHRGYVDTGTASTRCRQVANNYVGIEGGPEEQFGKTMSDPGQPSSSGTAS